MELDKLSEGDRILFNDRKTPLKVVDTGEDAEIEGPQGGRYVLYEEESTVLVSREGSRRYASKVENLRKTGEWKRNGDCWRHSKTDAKISIDQEETGNWIISVSGIIDSPDRPSYGFLRKEAAVDEVNSFVQERPEGK